MDRQTEISANTTRKYRADCKDCEAESGTPASEQFAETLAERHAEKTGHDVELVPVEDDRDDERARSPVREVWSK